MSVGVDAALSPHDAPAKSCDVRRNCKTFCRGGRPCPPGGTPPQTGMHQCGTGRIAWSPFVVRICGCILRGRGRTPPLRRVGQFYVFTIRCGKFAVAQRADRGVRPYRTVCVVADGACDFAIAHRRAGQAPPLHYDETPELIVRGSLTLIPISLSLPRTPQRVPLPA